MSPRALIRVDASPEIGLGHLSRCLSLAQALSKCGIVSIFVVRDPDPSVRSKIEAGGHDLVVLPATVDPGSSTDADLVLAQVEAEQTPPILIVDHYRIDARWEARLRPAVARLAVIDDLANRSHDCDLLVDQNRLDGAAHAYSGLLPTGTVKLIGPRYCLLHPEFSALRQHMRSRDGLVRTILVGFGGSDPAGHTQAVIEALRQHLHQIEQVHILVGSLNASRTRIDEIASRAPQFTVHVDAVNVGELLQATDLAIGAGGVMAWERACLGVPSLVFGIVSNQVQNVRDMLRAGVAIGAPKMFEPQSDRIERWIDLALASPDLLRGVGERAAALVDGVGAVRVAARLATSAVAFRPARREDSATLHSWRNHPSIRAVSLSNDEIDRAEHERWFEWSLANPHRLMLIAEADGQAVGVARFDLSGRTATISVYKDPNHQGALDLVGQATKWLFDNLHEIDDIAATVLAYNDRSIRAFEAAGYRLHDRRFVVTRAARNIGEALGSRR